MSMFWWLVKNEQLRYYRNRNKEFERREKERKEREQRERQQKELQRKEHIEYMRKYDEAKKIVDEAEELAMIVDCIYLPSFYNPNGKIDTSKYSIYDLQDKAYKLKKDLENNNMVSKITVSSTAKFKLDSAINTLEEMIKKQPRPQKQNNIKKDDRPNLSNPQLYNRLMTNIKNKKFKNEKEKLQMIRIVGQSGLTTEERKRLISMIK